MAKEHTGRHRREKGGELPMDAAEKMRKEARKRGGKVHGKAAEMRPDRRARGGATSDADPLTSAGKMSVLPYERKSAKDDDSSGEGADKD